MEYTNRIIQSPKLSKRCLLQWKRELIIVCDCTCVDITLHCVICGIAFMAVFHVFIVIVCPNALASKSLQFFRNTISVSAIVVTWPL